MDDRSDMTATVDAADAMSASKFCWFNFSSFLFSSSSSQHQGQPLTFEHNSQQTHHHLHLQSDRTPKTSPAQVRKRSSPRFSNSLQNQEHHDHANENGVEYECTKNAPFKKQRQPHSVDTIKSDHDDDYNNCVDSNHVNCGGVGKNATHGLSAKDAPGYLTFNPFITGGYRNNLSPIDCVKSLFWWTNETLNIWSHLLGWFFFFALSVSDFLGVTSRPQTQPWDQPMFALLLVCFQACMFLSAGYHVFCCCSESSYRRWLSMDLLGVSLSLLAIFLSGIYFAFSCVPSWLNFYLSTVAAIFVICLTCTFLRRSDGFSHRLLLFGGWATYGFVPTIHWFVYQGGWDSPAVSLLFPRILWMYVISALAFFFYVSKLPERWKPGLVNYIGSSHQIWHVLIVAALYHWYNTGLLYLEYRSQNSCSIENSQLQTLQLMSISE